MALNLQKLAPESLWIPTYFGLAPFLLHVSFWLVWPGLLLTRYVLEHFIAKLRPKETRTKSFYALMFSSQILFWVVLWSVLALFQP